MAKLANSVEAHSCAVTAMVHHSFNIRRQKLYRDRWSVSIGTGRAAIPIGWFFGRNHARCMAVIAVLLPLSLTMEMEIDMNIGFRYD